MKRPKTPEVKPEQIISTTAELKKIAGEIGLFNASQKKTIRVRFGNLSEETNRLLESKVQKLYSACGCSQGRMTGIFTFIIYIILIATGVISVYELGIKNTILIYFGCSVIAMLIGKMAGLRKARKSLFELINEIESNIANTQQHGTSLQGSPGTY